MAKYLVLMSVIFSAFLSMAHATTSEKQNRWKASLDQILIKPKPIKSLKGNEPVITLFTIHGSNTIGGSLAPRMAMSYLRAKGFDNVRIQPLLKENEHVIKGELVSQGKTVQIKVAAHGSSTGFKRLINGEAEVWASSRPVKEDEMALVTNSMNLRSSQAEHILGIDGLAIVVNVNNPVTALSKRQLAQIFSGEISNWSEVGGSDQAINLYARDENSGTWDSFKNMVLDQSNPLSSSAIRFESSEELVSNVVKDKSGIGFVGLAFVGNSKLLAISDGLAQAFKPDEMTVATEDYALSRRLFLYINPVNGNEFVNEFIGFTQSILGQEIVKTEGFISQNVVSMNMILNENLPADYLKIVNGSQRLSINFRFNEGSAKLDNKTIKDIQRLVYYLKSSEGENAKGDNQIKKITLIGFGDKRKNTQRSKLLSKLRAMAVRRELVRLGIHPIITTGYGDFNPVAAFNGNGPSKNRRVEIWAK